MNGTTDRRAMIRKILADQPLGSQEELLQVLAERGVRTTQPVLSRDLRAMQVAKRAGLYQLVEDERITPLTSLRSLLRSTCPAGDHMVVFRTEPGAASAVARALEAEEIDGLLGTVAGDDTVFAAVADVQVSGSVQQRVAELL